jgi:hypothetical protein
LATNLWAVKAYKRKALTMNYVINNFFELTDSQECACAVASYRINHSLMLVKVDNVKSEETFYLTFSGVLYFEGPLKWQGGNFCIETVDECEKLLRKIGYGYALHVLDKYRLFVVNLPSAEVKILALEAIKTVDIPPNFPWLIESLTK